MKILYSLLTLAIIISACSQPEPQIDYETAIDTTNVVDDRLTDTTRTVVAELPIQFDSTDILIYPVGLVNLGERGGFTKIGSGSYSGSSYADVSYSSGSNYINGNLINLIFEDSAGNRTALPKFKKKINRARYLESTFKSTRKQYLLYSIYDRDTNGDHRLSSSDLEALYISYIDGTHFRKLTKELHELNDYKLLKKGKMLYFRTLEDINQDGRLNNKDKFHYYHLDLSAIDNEIIEYNPLDVLMD